MKKEYEKIKINHFFCSILSRLKVDSFCKVFSIKISIINVVLLISFWNNKQNFELILLSTNIESQKI